MAAPSIANLQTLPAFLASAGQLTLDDQRLIVDQALDLLTEVYVHLPLKRSMHAIDPAQSLRLLQRQLDSATDPMKERLFHNLMIGVFVSLRDLHTNYILPDYFASYIAFLPFYLEEYWEGDQCHYVVSKLMDGFNHPDLKPGAVVRYWNGIPIDRAVEINAEKNAGSNPDARHARGLQSMTLRPMSMSLPPDEEWVIVGYEADGALKETRVDWQVYKPDPQNMAFAPPGSGSAVRTFGLDYLTESVRRAKVHLFHRDVFEKTSVLKESRTYGSAPTAAGIDTSTASSMPDILSFRSIDDQTGYLRIYSFAPPDDRMDPGEFVDKFVAEVVRILGLLPKNGLILDVRGNGGGVITAGERLLQLFTPRRIEPEPFSFINTPTTRTLVDEYDELKVWGSSIDQAVETGAAYSQGFPLTSPDDANAIGQVYQGPVVLITNALIYSTTDIFSAGFQDHAIGPVLGTAGNTGAGGANVWDYSYVQMALPDLFKPLPKGVSMRAAVRRSTRVGSMSGMPLEDLGVIPDAPVHKMTRNDIFQSNVDLISQAVELLRRRKLYSLTGAVEAGALKIQSQGVTRVDVYLNGRPALSVDVKDGPTATTLAPSAGAKVVLQGFDGDRLVVSGRV
ncbi:MAG TPA: S41 family peptidase [Verrucomicrobiae bacterium]|nr:S41 family peptidase [Verrucomicrobiae bacterium]